MCDLAFQLCIEPGAAGDHRGRNPDPDHKADHHPERAVGGVAVAEVRNFGSIGLPPSLAYAVFAAEAVDGAMLLLGVQARWAALALAPVLAGATWAHAGNGWVFTNAGGGWEYPLLLTVLALVQALLGDGAFVLSRSRPLPLALPRAAARPA